MTDFHIGKDIRLDTSDTHKYGEILIHSEKGEVCTVHPIDGDEDTPNFPACHLIAAAPDLYESLKTLIERTEYLLNFSASQCEFCGDEDEEWGFIDNARDVLAKACGESS